MAQPSPLHERTVSAPRRTVQFEQSRCDDLQGPRRCLLIDAQGARAEYNEHRLSPNPPKDTDGRREDRGEDSGRGVRELQGR